MGKTNNIFTGIVRKKIGSVVGYKVKYGGKEKQGLRAYVATPSNPQTVRQAVQRAKIGPAQRFYKAFANILDHSFEGITPGVVSKNHFLSLAYQSGTPALVKGDKHVPVFPYVVCEGSLPIAITYDDEQLNRGGNYYTSLAVVSEGGIETVAQLSQALINGNNGIEEGDEITFMAVMAKRNSADTYTAHISFVVDTLSTLNLNDLQTSDLVVGQNEVLTFTPYRNQILAGATIVSRKDGDSWLYSPATMVLAGTTAQPYYNEQLVEAAVRSYMKKSASVTSDYILQQAFENKVQTISYAFRDFTVDGATKTLVVRLVNGEVQAFGIASGDEENLIVRDSGAAVKSEYTILDIDNTSVEVPRNSVVYESPKDLNEKTGLMFSNREDTSWA